MRNRKDGFTLVELLVVIGIIALLISVLLPALNKARESSKATFCLSNLRQLGIGIQLYRQYNKDYYPPNSYQVGFAAPVRSVYFWAGKGPDPKQAYAVGYTDFGTNKRYINKYISPNTEFGSPLAEFPLCRCPSDLDGAYDGYGNSYTGNYFFGGDASVGGSATVAFWTLLDPTDTNQRRTVKGAQIRQSSTFVVAGENAGVSKPYNDTNIKNFTRFHYPKNDRWNVLFADGHSTFIDVTTKRASNKDRPTQTAEFRLNWK